MGAAYFYHLTRRPLEVALAELLEAARKRDMRVAGRGQAAERLAWLDEKLWLMPEDGFLPHGLAGGAHDADQPILLTIGPATNGATCVMSVDGAEVSVDEVSTLDRVCVLFDGNDPAALDVARSQWKTLTGAGAAAQYWSEESGKWEKKAESG